MQVDPIIDEIREIRHRISEEFGHDPAKLVEHYVKLEQEEYADRLARTEEPDEKSLVGESP